MEKQQQQQQQTKQNKQQQQQMNAVKPSNIRYESHYRWAFTTPLEIAACKGKIEQRVKKSVNWEKIVTAQLLTKSKHIL